MKSIKKWSIFFVLLMLNSVVFAETDEVITTNVESKLSSDNRVSQAKIDVSTRDGIVSLKGTLQTGDEAHAAIEAASSIDGVKDIDTNNLTVKGDTQPYQDSYITAKVKGVFVREKLFGDNPIAVSTIGVETKDGTVYLTGTADKDTQVNTAIDLAKKIQGVKDVQSKVEVKASSN